jgi:hypothetical protein
MRTIVFNIVHFIFRSCRTPHPKETKEQFITRFNSIDNGYTQEEAEEICNTIWRNEKFKQAKRNHRSKHTLSPRLFRKPNVKPLK